MLRKTILTGVGALLLTACTGGPREADLAVDLGKETVTLDAQLHDLRVFTEDELEQARIASAYRSPALLLAQTYASDNGIEVKTWAYSVTDGGAELLHVVATMPRARFDACLQLADGGVPPKACQWIPLKLAGDAYVSALEEPSSAELLSVEGPTRWPTTATHLATRVGWKLAPAFKPVQALERVQADPAGMARVFEQVERFRAAVNARDLAAAQRELSAPPGVSAQARLFLDEAIARKRLLLLDDFLEANDLQGFWPRIPGTLERLTTSAREELHDLLPRGPAPRGQVLELGRLRDLAFSSYWERVIDRRQAAPGTSAAHFASDDLHIALPEGDLASQCAALVKRNRGYRRFCNLLVKTAPSR